MEKFNRFLYGFVLGLILPILFIWLYLSVNYPSDFSFFEIIQLLFPSVLLGKILLLSITPNLIGVFIFYKQDSFKLGIGILIAALPFLLSAMFML
jgi:hypothetical protein